MQNALAACLANFNRAHSDLKRMGREKGIAPAIPISRKRKTPAPGSDTNATVTPSGAKRRKPDRVKGRALGTTPGPTRRSPRIPKPTAKAKANNNPPTPTDTSSPAPSSTNRTSDSTDFDIEAAEHDFYHQAAVRHSSLLYRSDQSYSDDQAHDYSHI